MFKSTTKKNNKFAYANNNPNQWWNNYYKSSSYYLKTNNKNEKINDETNYMISSLVKGTKINDPVYQKTFCLWYVRSEYARKLFQMIAELHFESGYPYLLFDDTVNENNAHPGRIVMSNLCSEIIQVSSASEYNSDENQRSVVWEKLDKFFRIDLPKVL